MKNIMQKTILPLLVLALSFTACQKDEIPPIGEPESKLEGISDTWKLARVYQYDEKVANSDVKTYEITDIFITGPAPVITFDANSKTYTYDPGDSPNFLGASGTWQFDDDLYPTLIRATDAASGAEATWTLQGPTRPVDTELKIAVKRGCVDDASYYYLLVFERQ
jgi:hypothetical protein